MNKLSRRQEEEPIPEFDSLESKQNHLRNIQQRSRLDSQEWMLVLFSYYLLEKLVEIESVQQAQEFVQTQSPEVITNQMNVMMEDEAFLDSIIAELPDELLANASNSFDSGKVMVDFDNNDGGGADV